jgi:porphobilinogen deaminase
VTQGIPRRSAAGILRLGSNPGSDHWLAASTAMSALYEGRLAINQRKNKRSEVEILQILVNMISWSLVKLSRLSSVCPWFE